MSATAREFSVDVQDRGRFAAASASEVDLILGVVYMLLGLSILISLLGVANAMSLAVHERRRELGLLRAVGQTRRQAKRVVRLESVILSSFGTCVGLLLGTILGALVYVAATEGGRVVIPWASLSVLLLVGAVAGVGAAWRPARRVAKLPVLEAIAVE